MSLWRIYSAVLLLALQSDVTESVGTSFAVAFPPTMSSDNDGFCKIYVNSPNLGTVWYTAGGSTTEITLWPDLTRVFTFDVAEFRTTSGVEDKAIYVYSDVEMTVSVSNSRIDTLMDSVLALPLNHGPRNQYFILSYPTSLDEGFCLEGTPTSTYTVVATEDNTVINVYRYTSEGNDFIGAVNLNRGQTYTNSSFKTSDTNTQTFDLTGYYIETDKAISVTAGNPCSDPLGRGPAPVWASMPAIQNAGMRYMSHPISYPGGDGESYILRTLALQDDTTVTFNRADLIIDLNAGLTYDLSVDDNREVEVVECSHPCIVAQLSLLHDSSAIFMTTLPSVNNYVADAVFNYADESSATLNRFLSIIYDTTSPVDSALFLNDVDISGNNWVIHPLGFSYLEVAMDSVILENYNRLRSDDTSKKFSALVHTQGALGQGYGFIADTFVLTNGTGPDTNTTLPPPVVNQNYTYLINMEGDFISSTGVAFDEICTLQYSLNMQSEADDMVAKANGEIGSNICRGMSTTDVSVRSVSAPLTTDGTRGNTNIQFTLNTVLGEFGPPEIETCTAEIDDYLMIHNNWGNPVLDPIPGCPGVQFGSNRFNDTGNEWVCQTLKEPLVPGLPISEVKIASWIYSIEHVGNFRSSDGSSIPSGCLTQHNSNFISSTDVAVDEVNVLLSTGNLCQLDTLLLVQDGAILSSTGNSGLSYQQYRLDYPPDVDSAALGACGGLVSEYLADHSNWNQPILPPVSGCVNLVFDPEEFTENQRGWFCVDSRKKQQQ